MIRFLLLVQAGLILYPLKKEYQVHFSIQWADKNSKKRQKKFLLITTKLLKLLVKEVLVK